MPSRKENKRKKIHYTTITLCMALLLVGAWWCFIPRPPLLEGVAFSTPVLDRDEELLRLSLARDEVYRVRTPLKDIAPELVEATLLYEDRYFYQHAGVNPLALLRAFQTTYLSGGRRMGASTITMQLARLRYGLDTTTVWGKLQQIERAFALERHYSKEEILEAYLNLAPYGGNIEGVGAASLIYFQTKAANLTLTESLSLVGVPQNPARRNPLSTKKDSTEQLAASRERLSRIWLEVHPEDAGNAFFHSLPLRVFGPSDLPFRAPHVTAEALQGAAESGEAVRTTLDPRMQTLLEIQVKGFAQRHSREGMNNACAVLLHWPSMEVHGLVGSADFYNRRIMGQVDGTRARRSPGSTLKPFIYALGVKQGLIHPMSLLYDAPRNFKGYDPENSDQKFRGPISAREALVLSRNIPAITLANQLAKPDLYGFLQQAHVDLPQSREKYGLALVLGGGEVSPRKLAALYALLPNRGVWKEPVLFLSGRQPMLGGQALEWTRHAPSVIVTAQVKELWNRAQKQAKDGNTQESSLAPVSLVPGEVQPGPQAPAAGEALPGTSLLTPEAALLTLDMLRDNPSLQRTHYIGLNTPKLPVYWKTGTSNGYRDAWAAGVFGPYVLVVWVGNFDGKPNPAFTGAKAAGELFLDTAGAVDASESLRDTAFAHMDRLNLARVPVCADTGDIDTSLCPETTTTWFIPGVSPIVDSGIYRSILVDTETGLRACVEKPGRTRRVPWAFWPSDMQKVFREAGVSKKPPPPFGPECRQEYRNDEPAAGPPPRIRTPKEGLVYYRSISKPESGRIALEARVDADVETLFWFYNTTFIGSVPSGSPLLWTPPGGTGTLRVLDDHGRASSRAVKVELTP